MLTAANMSFSLCPLLTQGAVDMLSHHGSEEQKETWLPKLVSGEWTGTMNLTEPQAGSDVGALATRAVPADDGTWRITGQKIFITYGEHDLADNIVHLVLARVPDAPPGTRGISCFIVPKYLLDDDGRPGVRNDLRVVSAEHKVGIHASPTCVMSYGDQGGAVGYLIGEPNAGMRYMFTMMNNARLSVGLEGLALAERAYQQAASYARERRQGVAIGSPSGEPSPIVEHADVRRMLMTMRASIEAMRGAALPGRRCGRSGRAPPRCRGARSLGQPRGAAHAVCKAWCTDLGVELTSLAVQVHGGMGYIEETGVAQHWRDLRIAPIYEGTNGIQAMDLVGRKLTLDGGQPLKELLSEVGALADSLARDPELGDLGASLAAGLGWLQDGASWLVGRLTAGEHDDAAAGATPFLQLAGLVLGGYASAWGASAAKGLLDAGEGDAAFLADKIATARFYCAQLLPRAEGHLAAVKRGAGDLFAISAERL